MNDVVTLLLDNAAAVAGRVIVGTLLFGVLGLAVVALAMLKRDWVKVGDPWDPWPGRASMVLWVIVGLPAFALTGGIIGLGYGAASVVEKNHVTERITRTALQAVVGLTLKDATARSYVDGTWIKIEDIVKLVEAAPKALENVDEEGARATAREVGAEASFLDLSAKVTAQIALFIVRSEPGDRMLLVTPLVEDVKARDVDHDGKVAINDVIDAAIRIHLEPRAAKFTKDLVTGQALAPGAVGIGAVVVPIALCSVVRRRRTKASAPSS